MLPVSDDKIKSFGEIVEKAINFLYVATVVASISINIFDIFRLIDLSETFILYTNIPTIFIILVSFLLKITDIISLKKSFTIVVCTILANSIISIFQSRYLEDIVICLLRESLFIAFIITLSAFAVSRKLTYFITSVFCISIVILYFVTKDSYILENIPVLILIFIFYTIFINYLIYLVSTILYQLQYKNIVLQEQLEQIKTQNEQLNQLNEELYEQKRILKNKNDQLNKKDTKYTASQNELKKLNETKNKLFSVIRNDIQNPMHVIIGYSKFLIDRFKNMEEKKKIKYIEIIDNHISHLYYLLENLLTLLKSQHNVISFLPEEIDINHIISESVEIYNEVIKNKELEIVISLEPKLLAYADTNMIRTVIRNLIDNAVKYSYSEGTIKISGSKNKQFVTIHITDKGKGIPKNISNNIFELHENKSQPGTHGEKGTGYGLAISKEFIEKNNGKIWFKSIEGEETTFSFQLPRSK